MSNTYSDFIIVKEFCTIITSISIVRRCHSQLSGTETREKEKPVKPEKVAEDAGELIGKGLRKAWSVTKSFGKGLVDTIDAKEESKGGKTCSDCSTSVSSDSSFCPRCGKKLVEK